VPCETIHARLRIAANVRRLGEFGGRTHATRVPRQNSFHGSVPSHCRITIILISYT
jgi:hypothetical protein